MSREVDIIEAPTRNQLVDGAQWVEWQQWFDRLFKYINNTVLRGTTSGDAAATIKADQSYHGITAISAARTITLPLTSGLDDNHLLIIQDESGAAGSFTITIAAGVGDLINGAASVTITTNYGRRTLIKSSSRKWFSQ